MTSIEEIRTIYRGPAHHGINMYAHSRDANEI